VRSSALLQFMSFLVASTRHAPWFVVPADGKENARLIVSQIVLDAFDDLNLAYPETSAARRAELLEIRKQLEKE